MTSQLLFAERIAPRLVEEENLGAGASAMAVVKVFVEDPGGLKKLARGSHAALKKIHVPRVKDEAERQEKCDKIEREVAMLKSLRHSNIVHCYGVVQLDESTLGILMEYCAGNSVRHVYRRLGSGLDEEVVAVYVKQVLLGLKYLHDKGVVHRDIKALNVLLTSDGIVKVADFGSAVNLLKQKDGQFHSMQGSLWWMAPEVFQITEEQGGSVAADVWSLGCLVWELCVGALPFSHLNNEFALMRAIIDAPSDDELIPADAPIPENALKFIKRCLKRDPASRPTASELLEDPFVLNATRRKSSSVLSPASLNSNPSSSGAAPVPVPVEVQPPSPTQPIPTPDKLESALKWWAQTFPDGSAAASSLFSALRCSYLMDELLPFVVLDPAATGAAAAESTVIDTAVFSRFVHWFGPLEVFTSDVATLEECGYQEIGYSETSAYSAYSTSDDQHVLLSLLSKTWMQPLLSQSACEEKMRGAEPGTFAIRYTSKHAEHPGGFTLSVKGEHGVLHYRILRPEDAWSFTITPDAKKGNPLFFDSLDELVAYFALHGIRSPRSGTVYKLANALAR